MELENKVEEAGAQAPAKETPKETAPDTSLPSEKGAEPTQPPKEETPTQGEPKPDTPKPAEPSVPNISVYEKEYAETGGLKEESYKELEKLGLSKSVVDNYINGQKALVEASVNDIKTAVGGDEAFKGIISWAADNLSEADKAAYNKVVATNDAASIKLALSGLQAKYKATTGYAPGKNLAGTEGVTSGGYESNAQMVADMKDPRYKTDEAYRLKVAEKIKRSFDIK